MDALHDDAHFVWLQAGEVAEQGTHMPRLPLLIDLGAVDGMDRIRAGQVDWFVLTEDSDYSLFKTLLEHAGFNTARCEIRSYSTSSRLEAAIELASYLRDESPATKVLVHRDRDFMTPDEVERIESKIWAVGAIPFITRGSDIESYFVTTEHLAALTGSDVVTVDGWLNRIAQNHHIQLQHQFTRKRDEINRSVLYRGRANETPDTASLLGSAIPLSSEKRKGKEMLKRCNNELHAEFGVKLVLGQSSSGLDSQDILDLRLHV